MASQDDSTAPRLPIDVGDVVATSSGDHKWLTATHLDPTYWDRHQQRELDQCRIDELYHENSKFARCTFHRSTRSSALFLETPRFIRATSFIGKHYPKSPRIRLPLEGLELEARLDQAILSRRSVRRFSGDSMALLDLAKLLYFSCGITGSFEGSIDGGSVMPTLRAIPSGGGLYPCEVYFLAIHVNDLRPGLYHYCVHEHAVEALDTSDSIVQSVLRCIPFIPEMANVQDCCALFLISAVFERSTAKYGPRGYRLCLKESGQIAQNIALISEAVGLSGLPIEGFFDDELHEIMALDGVTEAVLYPFAIGRARPGQSPYRPVTPATFALDAKDGTWWKP